MPAACKVLNSGQLVAGCDLHVNMPPTPPLAPHVVVGFTGMADPSTSKASATVKAGWGSALGRQHDLGRGLYHFAPNLLLPLVILGGGNKAEFGCSSVIVGGCGALGENLPMAVAVDAGTGLNIQFDCGDPCPAPTSVCVASFNTVQAGFKAADTWAGVAAMAVDLAISWLVGKVVGGLSIGGRLALGHVLGSLGMEGLMDVMTPPASHEAVRAVLGWFLGTPVGYSFPGALGSHYGEELSKAANNYTSPIPGPRR